jgi:hypothetical protein
VRACRGAAIGGALSSVAADRAVGPSPRGYRHLLSNCPSSAASLPPSRRKAAIRLDSPAHRRSRLSPRAPPLTAIFASWSSSPDVPSVPSRASMYLSARTRPPSGRVHPRVQRDERGAPVHQRRGRHVGERVRARHHPYAACAFSPTQVARPGVAWPLTALLTNARHAPPAHASPHPVLHSTDLVRMRAPASEGQLTLRR